MDKIMLYLFLPLLFRFKAAAEALLGKHPDTSIIATLDEQGKLVFPKGKAFTLDSSVRINIVGHSEALEKGNLVFANG
jgi:hypothetical protein